MTENDNWWLSFSCTFEDLLCQFLKEEGHAQRMFKPKIALHNFLAKDYDYVIDFSCDAERRLGFVSISYEVDVSYCEILGH